MTVKLEDICAYIQAPGNYCSLRLLHKADEARRFSYSQTEEDYWDYKNIAITLNFIAMGIAYINHPLDTIRSLHKNS